jgi:HD-GYP domain-containing protein (c-di-GMP phosphodiesterase class II)
MTLEYAVIFGFQENAILHSKIHVDEDFAERNTKERLMVIIPDLSLSTDLMIGQQLIAAEKFQAYCRVPLLSKGQFEGMLEVFHRTPLNPDREWLDFLEAIGDQAAIAVENARLFHDLQRSNFDLVMAYDATIEGWSRALDLRDKETEGHTQRVTDLTVQLARTMGIGETELVHIRRGALLHDIGKLGVPDSILLKPGPLTADEWVIMRQHPVKAYELLLPITYLAPALDIPYSHHERWDGKGYPHGLKGEEIPFAARIFAIVDVWDALTSDRPYRPACSKEEAMAYVQEQYGKHFCPVVVDEFVRMIQP